MGDLEELEKAGINPETGESIQGSTSSEPTQSQAPEQPQQPAVEMFELGGNKYPVTSEFQLTHNGKLQKVPYATLANTWRQAAHMSDKYGQFKKEQESFAQRAKDYDQLKSFHDKYGKLQEWSEKNPKEWAALEEVWKNKDKYLLQHQMANVPQGQEGQPQFQQYLQPLLDEISNLKNQITSKYEPMLTKIQEREAQEAEAKDIDYIKGQINGFKKEFSEINLDEKDPDGLPVWAKITQWGHSNGYTDFESAARVYLKERIAEVYKERAHAEVMKVQKQDAAQGIIKRSATPFTQGQEPQLRKTVNLKKKSYGDLAEEAKAELAAMGG